MGAGSRVGRSELPYLSFASSSVLAFALCGPPTSAAMRAIDPRPGQRLRQLRQHRKISQGRLARALGISVGTIQNYEHGRVSITVDRLLELAQTPQSEPAELLRPRREDPCTGEQIDSIPKEATAI
jgi:DNA-binding transcriptional regulator YiaG